MATIYDVARVAGVSPKTVSRVLNGDAPVGDSTKKKVKAAIADLGYVPSSAARTMRSNKSGLIGLITGAISRNTDPREPHGLPDLFIVQGIQQVMAEVGKTLIMADTGGDYAKVAHLAHTFQQHRVEGLVYVADHHMEVEIDVSVAKCPVVLANCYDKIGTPSVLPDDRNLQKKLVKKIIQTGHTRIGFVTLDSSIPASIERTKGYKEALAEANLPFDPMLITVGYSEGSERDSVSLSKSLDQLLSLSNPPTVLCCGNDEMALRVYGLLRTRGVKVPEQISVAGFDNYHVIAETLVPPLTTVELPYRALGHETARKLLAMVDGVSHQPERATLVEGPVAWRSSVTALNSVSHINLGRELS